MVGGGYRSLHWISVLPKEDSNPLESLLAGPVDPSPIGGLSGLRNVEMPPLGGSGISNRATSPWVILSWVWPGRTSPGSAKQAVDVDTPSGKRAALLRIKNGASENHHSQHDREIRRRLVALVIGLRGSVLWRPEFPNFRPPSFIVARRGKWFFLPLRIDLRPLYELQVAGDFIDDLCRDLARQVA